MALKPVYKNGLPVVLNGQALEVEETGEASGGGWFLIGTYTVPETEEATAGIVFSKDANGNAFSVREVMVTYNGTIKEGIETSAYVNINLTDADGKTGGFLLSRATTGATGTTYIGSTKIGLFDRVYRQETIGGKTDMVSVLIGAENAMGNAVAVKVSCLYNGAWSATPFAEGGKITVYGRN